MSADPIGAAHTQAQIRDGLSRPTRPDGTYRPGDHLRDRWGHDPVERPGADELDAITPPRHPALPPVQEWWGEPCEHGEPDDWRCERCWSERLGQHDPFHAALNRKRRGAA